MSLTQEETFRSFFKSSSLIKVKERSLVDARGLATLCLNYVLVLISYKTDNHSWASSCIFCSSKSTKATSILRKNAGIIVDIYEDTFQFSELKNRPKNNVASSGSI